MLNAHLAQLARRWVHRIRRPDAPTARRSTLRVEAVEERLAPATLPVPLVSDTRTVFGTSDLLSNGLAPQAAIDPTDPTKQVLAFANGNGIQFQFSTDSGRTWTRLFNNGDPTDFNARLGGVRLPDPTRDPGAIGPDDREWDQATSPAVAFGRDGRVYLTHVQKANDSSRGVLVVDVFDFSDFSPVSLIRNKVVYAWNGNDPAFNPTIAVDANSDAGGFDPGAGRGAVYIAWNTNADVPNGQNSGFNPTAVLMSASSDGGQTFSAPFFVSDNQYFTIFSGTNGDNNSRMVSPQIAIAPSQPVGGGTVQPGQVTVAYNSVGTASGADIFVNNAAINPTPNGVPGFFSVDAAGASGFIGDGVANFYPTEVSVPSGHEFTSVTGVTVNVSLKHPNLSQVRLRLFAPDGSVVTLLENRNDAAGNARPGNPGLGGGDAIGFVRAAKSFGSTFGGRFTETAPRRITDANTKAPYNNDMRPEDSFFPGFGGLAGFEGNAATNLQGQWFLEVTDFKAGDADAKNPQQLLGWSLNVTGGLGDESFFGARTVVFGRGGSLNPGEPLGAAVDFGSPNTGPASPTVGYGGGVSLAYDRSVGGPNSGNLYLAYTGAGVRDTKNPAIDDIANVYLVRSTDGGQSFATTQLGNFQPFLTGFGLDGAINSDVYLEGSLLNPGDNYSEGVRAQFQPTLTVDPATGTLVAMWYDARNDSSNARAATYLATSIDGGVSFSDQTYQFSISKDQALTPAELERQQFFGFPLPIPVTPTGIRQPFLNFPKTAYDATDINKGVLIEPIPSNANVGNAGNGFGPRQAVLAFGGKIYPYWAGNTNQGESKNDNRAAVQVFSATVSVAAGPRVVAADMGPVINPAGRPTLDGFRVTFDRPVDPASFTPASVRVGYVPGDTSAPLFGSAGVPPGSPVAVAAIEPDPLDPASFFVRFAATQTGVGAYSYYIDSNAIRDTVVRQDVTVLGPELPALPAVASTGTDNGRSVPEGGGNGVVFGAYDNTVRQAAVSTITIPALPAGQAVGRVVVMLNVSSTAGDNLQVNLVSPSGVRVTLIDQAGLDPFFGSIPGTQFINTILDDTATTSVQDPFVRVVNPDYTSTVGAPDPFGPFTPAQPTFLFAGESAGGTWRLEVIDLDGGTTSISTIDDWSLQIVPVQLAPAPVNLMDQNANGSANEAGAVDGFAAPGRLNENQAAFVGGLDSADTYPLVIPGPRLLGTAVTGAAGFTPGVETTYRDKQVTSVDLVFDRPIPVMLDTNGDTVPDTVNFSKNQIVRITTPTGVLFDAVALQNDNLAGSVTTAAKNNRAAFDGLVITPVNPDANGATDRFTVTFPGQQVSGTYAVQIASSIQDTAGFKLDQNANAGVARVYRDGDQATSFVSTTYSSKLATPGGLPIPAADKTSGAPGVVELPLQINDNGVIQSGTDLAGVLRRVLLRLDITYPNDPDLTADLVPPDGPNGMPIIAPIRLFNGVGARGASTGTLADFRNTLFDDQSNSPIQLGTPPFDNTGTGAFAPQFPLNDLSRFSIGTQGVWRLRITNVGNSAGRVNYFDLTLPTAVVGSGVGEPTADRGTGTFRINNFDPTANPDANGNPLSERQWTPVGPAPILDGQLPGAPRATRSSRTTAIAVDPSDPTGNTVYLGGATGGIWKTTDFLNQSQEPTYIPLTDFGPTSSLSIGNIEVIGRNGDPNQSILIVATGEGDTSIPGVGFLLSFDAGRTWRVIDSTVNVDRTQPGRPFLSVSDPARDRLFVGTSTFKIVADPVPQANGDYYLYAAVSRGVFGSPAAAGVWRSRDTGRTWERIQAGNATDVMLARGTAPQRPNPGGGGTITGNTEVLYAAVRGFGVFLTPQATSVAAIPAGTAAGGGAMTLMSGSPGGNPLLVDVDLANSPPVPVGGSATPTGGKGRISIAGPALTGDRRRDTIYAGWLYAVVSTPDDQLDGIYVTKDFGANWTQIHIPFRDLTPGFLSGGTPTQNKTLPDNPLFGSAGFGQGNYDQAIAVDPNNPAVIYVGGSQNGAEVPLAGYVRVDTSFVADAQNLTGYSNTQPGDTGVQFQQNQGPAIIKPAPANPGPGGFYGLLSIDPVTGATFDDLRTTNVGLVNLSRDPINPLLTGANSTLFVSNVQSIANHGYGAKWQPFGQAEVNTDVHRILTVRDPLTGKTRIITADDQGTATVVDNGDGTFDFGIGGQAETAAGGSVPAGQRTGLFQPTLFRNGNLQINQFYQGAVQPSQLAADIAGALFYGSSQDNGSPRSTGGLIRTGNLDWAGPQGDATGVATDQTGSGTAFQFRWPCCGGNLTDFFRVLVPGGTGGPPVDVGRTFGLVQPGDNIRNNVGNWRFVQGSTVAVNPIDAQGLLVSANGTGRLFRSTNQGVNWFPIAEPGVFGNNYTQALAFGSPEPNDLGLLNNYILVGTSAGTESSVVYGSGSQTRSFVTFTGTFTGPQIDPVSGKVNWQELTIPPDPVTGAPDFSGVRQYAANPRRGMKDAYMVTGDNVYYIPDTTVPGASWVNITGNLFSLTRSVYSGDEVEQDQALRFINAVAADWRFANPIGGPTDTAPTLYVGGDGGVFRSVDRGTTWTFFPDTATDQSAVEGGYLPNAIVSDLDLAIGDIDTVTGMPKADGALNLLVASTYGRGSWAIRLDQNRPNLVLFTSGPKVAANGGIQNPNPVYSPGTTSSSDSLFVVFDTAVDPTSFDTGDVTLLDPAGNPVTVTAVTPVFNADASGVDQQNKFLVTFAAQTRLADGSGMFGKYTLSIGVDLYDFAGNRLNQNANTVNGENPADVFTRAIFLNQDATNLVISGLPAQVVAGQTTAFTLRVENGADGSVLTGFTGSVTFTVAPTGAGSVTPSTVTFTAANQGQAQVTATFTKAGPVTVSAAATSGTANPASVGTVVVAAPATQFVIGTFPNTVAGVAKTFTLEAQDQFGNTDKAFKGTVSLSSTTDATFTATLATAPGTPLTPPNTYTFTTADQGAVAFSGVFTKAGTDRDIVIDGPGTVDGKIVNIVVAPDVAKTLSVTQGLVSPMTAGVPQNLVVTSFDQFGNVAANPITANVTLTDPTAPPISPVTFSGVLTVPVQFNKAALSQTVTVADASGTLASVSSSAKVVAAAVSQFGLADFPTTVKAGVASPLTITAQDQFGNTNTGFTGKVTVGGSDGTTGTVTFTATGAGVAKTTTFLTKAGTNRVVTASSGTLFGSQGGITVTADSATQVTVTPLPDPYTAGAPVLVTVTAFDKFGNQDAGFAGKVLLTSTDAQAVLAPSPYTFVAGDGGQKVFTVALKTAGLQTVSVEPDSSAIVGAESTVTVLPGAASTFVLTGFPQTVQVGVAKSLTVTARDAFGNLAANYAGTVLFSSSDGKASLPAPSTLTNGTGKFSVTLNTPGVQSLTVTDSANPNAFGVLPGITVPQPPPVVPPPPPPPPPQNVLLVGTPQFAVGADAGLTPAARLFNANDRTERFALTLFDPLFTGGVRTAAGDLNGDGVSDLVAATGPGIITRVQAFDGKTQQQILDIQPFEDAFTGGVFLAVGDVNGDGRPDLVVSPDEGGGPRIDVYSGNGFGKLNSFFAFPDDPNFRGGARPAVGDVNGDGKGEVVVSAGFGGGPRIATFDGTSVASGNPVPARLFNDFFAFESSLRNGAFVAVGDVNGDGKADLVLGGGPGGGPRVTVFSGNALMSGTSQILANFFGGNTASRGGIRVAVKDVDGDQRADVIVGAGTGAGTRVTGYLGKSLGIGTAPVAFDLDALPTFDGGVFVG